MKRTRTLDKARVLDKCLKAQTDLKSLVPLGNLIRGVRVFVLTVYVSY